MDRQMQDALELVAANGFALVDDGTLDTVFKYLTCRGVERSNPEPHMLEGADEGWEDYVRIRVALESVAYFHDCRGEEHVCEWGQVEYARFTGNPHRKCLTCGNVNLDLSDDDD